MNVYWMKTRYKASLDSADASPGPQDDEVQQGIPDSSGATKETVSGSTTKSLPCIVQTIAHRGNLGGSSDDDQSTVMPDGARPLGKGGRSADLAFCAGEIVGRRNSHELRLLDEAMHVYRQWSSVRPFWA